MGNADLLAAGVWTYAVLGIMLVAGLILLRALLVPGNVAFAPREQLLNDDQKRLYQALLVWAGDRWVIFCKVPLIELIRPRGAASFRRSWFESLSQHQVDFVLCDPLSTRVRVAISLGNANNNSQASAVFVGDVLRRAGLAWLEVPIKSRYSADEIQRLVGSRLN